MVRVSHAEVTMFNQGKNNTKSMQDLRFRIKKYVSLTAFLLQNHVGSRIKNTKIRQNGVQFIKSRVFKVNKLS